MNTLFPMENISARCVICGRRLTDPDSIAAGQGPVCRHGKAPVKQAELHFAPLTDRHRKVLAALEGCDGKAMARPTSAMVVLTGIPDRQVRELIRELVEDHGEPIGSCREGFYRIETEEEAAECRRSFLVAAQASLVRAAAFGRTPGLQKAINQLHHELEELP